MFDDALEGVITLLRLDSLSRFYDTKEYKTWSFALDDKKKKLLRVDRNGTPTPKCIKSTITTPTAEIVYQTSTPERQDSPRIS